MVRKEARDKELRARAFEVIPNGMYGHQSVAQMPAGCPQFFRKAAGARLWDADGNEYIDYLCGYGPNLFGYGNSEIDAASHQQARNGDTMTGPGEVMVELAEALTRQVSHADWAMFCKNGTDATTMSMMIARQHTGRKTILRARGAYHGAAPWCNPVANGTIDADRANQIFYDYNDVSSLEAAVREAGTDLAGIFASPFKHDTFVDQASLDREYAVRARDLCNEHGALLIVDDVRAGFRIARDCSWSVVGVKPDLSSWGKAIANGHPLSALLGANVCRTAAASIYVTGSYWYSAAPMAASLATLRLIRETDYLERTIALGDQLRIGLQRVALDRGFKLRQSGPSQMPLVMFEDDPTFARGYAWCSALYRRGVYFHPWHNMFICAALTQADIDQTIDAADDALREIGRTKKFEVPAQLLRNRALQLAAG